MGVSDSLNMRPLDVHSKTQCDSDMPSPAPHGTRQAPGYRRCHPACVGEWFLALAKELGWRVHRLEEKEVDELQHLSTGGVEAKCPRWVAQGQGLGNLPFVTLGLRRGYTSKCYHFATQITIGLRWGVRRLKSLCNRKLQPKGSVFPLYP
jgi:hypothetical protein